APGRPMRIHSLNGFCSGAFSLTLRRSRPNQPRRLSGSPISCCSGRRAPCISTGSRSRHGCHYRKHTTNMQKQLSILISTLPLTISAQVGAIDLNRPHHEHEHEQEKKQKYTCPMHPEVITEHPGNCPKCGMKLVPKKEETKAKPKSNARESHDM